MKKLFILLGLLMFSLLGCSCKKPENTDCQDVPLETRVLGGCVYKDRKGLIECSQPSITTHNYIGFIFEKKEYDIDEVEIIVYYGTDKDLFIKIYFEFFGLEYPESTLHREIDTINTYVFLREFDGKEISGTIEDTEIFELKNSRYLIDKIEFKDLESYPFEEYSFDVEEIDDERYSEKYVYNKSYKITIPKELFEHEEGQIFVQAWDYVYYKDGAKKVLHENICGGLQHVNYKKEGNKIKIWN